MGLGWACCSPAGSRTVPPAGDAEERETTFPHRDRDSNAAAQGRWRACGRGRRPQPGPRPPGSALLPGTAPLPGSAPLPASAPPPSTCFAVWHFLPPGLTSHSGTSMRHGGASPSFQEWASCSRRYRVPRRAEHAEGLVVPSAGQGWWPRASPRWDLFPLNDPRAALARPGKLRESERARCGPWSPGTCAHGSRTSLKNLLFNSVVLVSSRCAVGCLPPGARVEVQEGRALSYMGNLWVWLRGPTSGHHIGPWTSASSAAGQPATNPAKAGTGSARPPPPRKPVWVFFPREWFSADCTW